MTSNDFARISYSHSPLNIDWEELEDLSLMYEENMFTMEKILITTHRRYLQTIDLIEKERHKKVVESGDSVAHQALKLLGKKFLQEYFKVKAKIYFEHPLIGFEVDVVDEECTLLLECGDTNASKFENYLLLEQVKHFALLPYPLSNDVYAYVFTPLPELKKYLSFKRDYARQKIRQLKR